MILPHHIREFLKGPRSAYVGTRDKDFSCDILRVVGIAPTGHDSVKFFIAEKTADKTLDNLRANKIVTLSATNIYTSESYQMKGRMLNLRSANDEEKIEVREYIRQFDEAVSKVGLPEGLVTNKMPHEPALMIEFVVENIFDQTPKMGTGKLVSTV